MRSSSTSARLVIKKKNRPIRDGLSLAHHNRGRYNRDKAGSSRLYSLIRFDFR
jgi:hypothetical protein